MSTGLGKSIRRFREQQEKQGKGAESFLLHSRFRKCERDELQKQALNETAIASDGPGRILVTTQAIEAGVDISATTLFTEIAPWSSLVQRFGRCNRRGRCGLEDTPEAQVRWIDIDTSDSRKAKELALPYSAEELDTAREHLNALSDVGPASLEAIAHEEPQHIDHTLRRKDLLELWDTTPDLAGNDLDVSSLHSGRRRYGRPILLAPVGSGRKEGSPRPTPGTRKVRRFSRRRHGMNCAGCRSRTQEILSRS